MPLVVSDNPAVPCPGDAVAVTVSGIACVTRTVFTGLFFSPEFPIRLLYNGGAVVKCFLSVGWITFVTLVMRISQFLCPLRELNAVCQSVPIPKVNYRKELLDRQVKQFMLYP
jgi:hypothetical protein